MHDNGAYRLIDKEFLNHGAPQSFNIYILERYDNADKFVLFADRSKKQQDKLKDLLRTGYLEQPIYIRNEDRSAYFGQMATQLRELAKNDLISRKAATRKLFSAAREMVKDIYDKGFSKVMADTADVVVDTMKVFFSEGDIKFESMAKLVANDITSYTHSVNVAFYSLAYGTHVRLDPADLHALGIGALFHDIGLLKVPQEVLHKEGLFHDFGKLPDLETEQGLVAQDVDFLKNHPLDGKKMLLRLKRYPVSVMEIVEQHHESWDGSGYPNGLKKDKISYLARICKIADSFDTLRNPRSYRPKNYSPFDALNIMVTDLSGQFEPEILKNFIRIMGSS